MKEWRIPVTWEECGIVKIEAKTLKEAMEIAYDEKGEIPLPSDGSYVDGSWTLTESDTEIVRELYNDNQEDEFDFHHMDMENAIEKAKKLLAKNGVLIIVGLAKPSSLFDWIVEFARIIPSKIVSTMMKNTTSEELDIEVSYHFSTMKKVRQICNEKLYGYTLRYGLHYRYLLTWENN